MDFLSVIGRRRDGAANSRDDLIALSQGAATGEIPDYQLAAWLMAAYLRPLGPDETAWLTLAMAESGERLDLAGLPRPWVDKHSTGGVGDKTTIVLLPLLAACGLTIVKMSGRGLGITGGTVDKLASIPGFRLDLSPAELIAQAREIGLALTGQTANLAPADKALYALRDATGTVASTPLIVSSILSKKIAGGAETIVLDVKCGSGAFMKEPDEAFALADALVETGRCCGLNVTAAVSDMSEPLGSAVGNALEVREAVAVLANERFEPGSPSFRFRELCLALAGHTLQAAGLAGSLEAGRVAAERALASGDALKKADVWMRAQGSTVDARDLPSALARAPVVLDLVADREGWIEGIDAGIVGQAVVDLGGGRQQKEDAIDPAVGVVLYRGVGSRVSVGERLAAIHAKDSPAAESARRDVGAGVVIVDEAVAAPKLFLSRS